MWASVPPPEAPPGVALGGSTRQAHGFSPPLESEVAGVRSALLRVGLVLAALPVEVAAGAADDADEAAGGRGAGSGWLDI
eukprot:6593626-Alexandrium_andersonii.AAC.1